MNQQIATAEQYAAKFLIATIGVTYARALG
jgi:hypothetical protein